MIFNIHPTTSLLLSLIVGLLAALYARQKKKNPYLWFSLGFLFGIFGVLFLFYAPAPKRQKRKAKAPVKPAPTLAGPNDKFWYYLDPTHQQMGPMSFDALKQAWKQGKVTPLTYVWNEDLAEWKLLKEMIRE